MRRKLVSFVLGFPDDAIRTLANNFGIKESNDSFEAQLLQRLRSLPRDAAQKELNRIPKRMLRSTSIRDALDALYAVPRVMVMETKVQHLMDKVSNKSVGELLIKLEVDQQSKSSRTGTSNEFVNIFVVLGTMQRRLLLGKLEFSLGRGPTKIVADKKIKFDWDVANSHGGEGEGVMLLQILVDNVRGMDSSMLVKLR